MSSVNKVTLLGRTGSDPEIKYTAGGTAVAKFNLATSESWKDKGGVKQEKTEWHKVVVFGKLAETVAEYVHKGDQLYLEGKLTTRSWDDKDGVKKYTTEVNMTQLVLLGGKKQGFASAPAESAAGGVQPPHFEDSASFQSDNEGDIPF